MAKGGILQDAPDVLSLDLLFMRFAVLDDTKLRTLVKKLEGAAREKLGAVS
ncbi:MAG: hypothetical protein ACJ76N_15045 [Thermoanaerobaculia bacterium]